MPLSNSSNSKARSGTKKNKKNLQGNASVSSMGSAVSFGKDSHGV